MVRHARQHEVFARELDFRLNASIVTEKMNAVPGFRTSAAFFTFLRANLALPPSATNSTISTPLLDASSSQFLPPLRPSSLSTLTNIDSCSSSSSSSSSTSSSESIKSFPSSNTSFSDDTYDNGETDIITEVLWLKRDKEAALKLVADSIIEQRTKAFKAIVYHPLVVGWWILLAAFLWKLGPKLAIEGHISITAFASITIGCLAGAWNLSGTYLKLAKQIDSSYLRNDSSKEEDIVIGSRFGDSIVGAAVLRIERTSTGSGKRRKAGGKGLVRAWTVQKQHRRRGNGRGLLEEVVRVTREKVGNAAEIGFAVQHANSGFVLPEFFDRGFRREERRAARCLEEVVGSLGKGVERGRWKKR